MPLLGPGTVACDLALTPVVVALLSTLIGEGLARRKIGDGRISVPPGTCAPAPLQILPRGVRARSAALAAACALLLAWPLWLLLPLGVDGLLTALQASGTKILLTVTLSLLIVSVVTMAALADVQRSATGSASA